MTTNAADVWHHIRLPALAEEGDPIGRFEGEPLWPARYDLAALATLQLTAGPRDWAGLYQQSPVTEQGNLFHRSWWSYYVQIPEPPYLDLIQTWDTAFKDNTRADYSVCGTWARTSDGIYLLDIYRQRPEYPDLLPTAQSLYAKYHPTRILIEDKASGQSLIQDLHRLQLPVIAVKDDADKYRRASVVTGLVQSGLVHLPQSTFWLHDFIEELATFPESAHDDQVDVVSMALSYFKAVIGGGSGRVYREPKPEGNQWEDRNSRTTVGGGSGRNGSSRKTSAWRD